MLEIAIAYLICSATFAVCLIADADFSRVNKLTFILVFLLFSATFPVAIIVNEVISDD